MRLLVVAGIGLLAASGCLDAGETPQDPLPAPVTRLQYAGASGIEDVEELAGLGPAATGPGSWTWHPLDGLERDSIRLLAVQSLEAAAYRYETENSLVIESPPPGSERPAVDGVCRVAFAWNEAPGRFYLARAMGVDDPYPEDAQFSGTLGSSFGSGSGNFGGKSGASGELDAGEWLLFGAALGGYDPGLAQQDGSWAVDFEVGGPVRIVELRPAQFACGPGFRNVPGTESTPDPIPSYQGGSLTVDGLYGGTFGWCPGFDVLGNGALSTAMAGYDRAAVDFMGNVTRLTPVLGLLLEDGQHRPMTLTVEQWFGSPHWLLAGFRMPVGGLAFAC